MIAFDKTVPPFLKNPQLLALHMRDTLGSGSDLLTDVYGPLADFIKYRMVIYRNRLANVC